MLFHCKDWCARPAATIRWAEIDKLLETIRDGSAERRAAPYMANRMHVHLKDFFQWCVEKKKIAASPMSDMRQPWKGAKPRDRAWFKGDAADLAVKSIWQAADQIGGSEARYLKMMILTGKRKGALAAMQWQEIGSDWFWNAPPSTAKNKRLHGVPLPALAQRVLHPRKSEGRVFDVMMNMDALQREIRERTSMQDFFYHGVRHLVETKLAELKIAPHIRDLLLDHVPARGAGAGYDHYHYRDEMRQASSCGHGMSRGWCRSKARRCCAERDALGKAHGARFSPEGIGIGPPRQSATHACGKGVQQACALGPATVSGVEGMAGPLPVGPVWISAAFRSAFRLCRPELPEMACTSE